MLKFSGRYVMKMLLLLLFIISFTGYSQDLCTTTGVFLGETPVSIERQCYRPCNSRVLFVNLHDNETASVEAATHHLLQNGGTLIRVDNYATRLVTFCSAGEEFLFDPNRIYSQAGREATLKLLSGQPTPKAAAEVSKLAWHILSKVNRSKLIIALHNNTDSNFSILTYRDDQELKHHFGKVYINPLMDPDDFVLTTNVSIFNFIKTAAINVVYENTSLLADDGSLSVYAGRRHIAYINVEAQQDHADEQCAMIAALEPLIKRYANKK